METLDIICETIKKLDDRIEKLDEKQDRQTEVLAEIQKTLAVNTESLAYHIKRTDQLEGRQELVEKSLEPIKTHILKVETIFKVVCWICGAIAGFASFFAVFKALI